MADAWSPLKRFLLHSLWVVLPFCALLALTWSAWRSDAETRSRRILENARLAAVRALDEIQTNAGPWSPMPIGNHTENPPPPNDDPAAKSARDRYEAGDFEGVLGSPESLRSAAGLPLRKLAALQLLRKESDPGRLGELVAVLTGSLDFTSPPFLEEAERRFAELKMEPPPALKNWHGQWQRVETEAALFQSITNSADSSLSKWIEQNGVSYLVELNPKPREWRVWGAAEVKAIASNAQAGESTNLAEGTALQLVVAGKTMAGPDGKSVLISVDRDPWRAEIVLADDVAFRRNDLRTRNFMTSVLAVAGLAALFGLFQSGRAYFRAVELARRQSEFMAAVSHEMRTPLAAMGLLAENLASGVADRAGQRDEHTRMIREECARLGGLVDNVLAFTRDKPSDACEAFDVPAMIADAVSLVNPVAERNRVELKVDVAEFPEAPHGDAQALRRALLNLLDNALKHTPAGGKVICHARPLDGSHWAIVITDTGPGIPANERVRIFEPFYRIGEELRRTTPGTGLGLALVKRTAEAHGGRVEVDDAPHGGSRFTLTLPIHP